MPSTRVLAGTLLSLAMWLFAAASTAAEGLVELASRLADRYQLQNDAILIADAGSRRPLLCLARVDETGDSVVTDHTADLLCRGRVASWHGENRWVRISGMAEFDRSERGHQTLVLYGFENVPGSEILDEASVSHYLRMALVKAPGAGAVNPPIDVDSGSGGEQ